MRFCSQMPHGCGKVLRLDFPQERDRQVPDRSQNLRGRAGTDTTSVLPESHVANVMQSIFDTPVGADIADQGFRIRLMSGQARNAIDDLRRRHALDLANPCQTKHLRDTGPIQVIVENRGRCQCPDFKPPVAFIGDGFRLTVLFENRTLPRGKGPPAFRTPERYRLAATPGFP